MNSNTSFCLIFICVYIICLKATYIKRYHWPTHQYKPVHESPDTIYKSVHHPDHHYHIEPFHHHPVHHHVVKVINVPSLKLKDGHKIPMVGLGTDNIKDEHTIKHLVYDALKVGYKHLDMANINKNEQFIGQKLRVILGKGGEHNIKRSSIYLTSKLWSTSHSRFEAVEALLDTMKRLNTTYLDMYLIHYPFGFEEGGEDVPLNPNGFSRDSNISVVDTWKGLEDAHRMGQVRSIGVANFNVDQLARIVLHAAVRPAINMLEVNPYLTEECLIKYCQTSGIQVMAYNPLSKSNQTLLNEPVLKKMSHKYHKSVPQIIMRWLIQRNIAVIPEDKSRLIENIDIFDFKLSAGEMKKIFKLNKNHRTDRFEFARYNNEYPFNNMCYN